MPGIRIIQSDLDFILKQLRLPNNSPVLPIDMTGIRDVQGVGNNVANPSWGAGDTPFMRLFTPDFSNYTPNTFAGFGPAFSQPGAQSSYQTRDINLQDASPRLISNLVNNSAGLTNQQLLDNPADTPGGRLSPLTGLVNPLVYSGYFTLMGQFFDHGLDFVQKGADGYVVVKLQPGDDLYNHPDNLIPGSNPPAYNNFMIVSRTNTVHVDIGTETTDSLKNALGLLEQRYTTVNPTTVEVNGVTRDASYVLGTGSISPTGVINGGLGGVLKLNNSVIDIAAGSTGADLIAAINAKTVYTGVSASINGDKLQLTYLNGETINRISPFIDLSQQYGSDPSQTAFLREYSYSATGAGQITGSLAGNAGPGLGIATWADIKANALNVGVVLHDVDVLNVPEVRLASNGAPFIGTGAQQGMWLVARDTITGNVYYVKNSAIALNTAGQVLDANGTAVAGGNLATVLSTLKLQVINHAFLDDIAHNVKLVFDANGDFTGPNAAASLAALNAHYVAGDGRTNENIGLTSIHDIFHSEHEVVLNSLKALDLQRQQTDVTYVKMTAEELFQAAKLVVEMEYQHMIFGEFARKLSPNIGAFAAYDPTLNPAISAEFAHAVYRLGHSMLTDNIDVAVLNNGLKVTTTSSLFDNFLAPGKYAALNASGQSAAADVAMGMSAQVGNAIDQWMTDVLRNKLVGLPLDLATANIVRGRDTGLPTFEEARDAVFAQTGMIQFARHDTWYDFAGNLIHPETVVDFIAAYASNAILGYDGATLLEKAQAASVDPDFMSTNQNFRDVDLWVGGLAEAKETNGMLGTLFDFVFATQMAHLQNNDRFYYLGRLVGTDLLAQIESQLLSDIVQRNSGATHIYKDIFSVADNYVEMSMYNKASPTHSVIAKGDAATDLPSDAGYAADGTFYGDRGNYYDARSYEINAQGARVLIADPNLRGPLSPNGKGNASEMIGGTSLADKINALGGNDTVYGDGGNDTIDGGNGNDFLHGGDGDDRLDDFGGDDFLWGDAGNDTVNGGAGIDQVFGGSGNDDVYGSDGADIVDGGLDNDLVYGDWGRSTAAVGTAQYMHYVRPTNGGKPTVTISTSATPLVVAGATDTVILLNGVMDGLGGADIISGGDGHDVLFGGGGNDALDGGDGNDTLIGGNGADAYLGGLGDDLFLADSNDFAFNNTMDGAEGFDTVSYQLSVRGVSISLANAGLAIVPPGTNVLDAFINVEGLIGSNFNDVLMGSNFDNVIEGLAGNDTIDGGLGNCDLVSYASVAGSRGVTINLGVALQNNTAAGVGTDTLLNIEGVIGTKNVDNLTGNALDNIFEGLAGNDVINGGLGNDTASYKSALSNVTINLANNNGVQTGNTVEVGNDTLISIENIIGGFGNDTLTGTNGNNVIDGGPGGNDTLAGGTGNDTVSYTSALSSVIVNLTTGSSITYNNGGTPTTVTAAAGFQIAVGSGLDRLSGFENVTGSDFNDSLTGDAAVNIITGGLGDDSMAGGAGNDLYILRDAAEMGINEIITDSAGTADEIRYTQTIIGATPAANTLVLSNRISGVERVTIATGVAAVTYTAAGVVTGSIGIEAMNIDASAMTNASLAIVGNAGNNILAGTKSVAGDTLVGGLGNDTYVVSNALDVVLEGSVLATEIDTVNVDFATNGTYSLGANIENGTIIAVNASLLLNLTGNALANTLTGNAGNNILDGGAGADNLVGGLGDDTYVVDSLLDVVVENQDEGIDTIRSSITYSLAPALQAATGTYSGSLDVENLTLIGTGNVNGTGNDLDNVITGNAGNNILNGGLGIDTLIGGAGNDTYVIDNADIVIELAGGGTDAIQASVSYTLTEGSEIENLILGAGNIDGTGNSLANTITGGTGNNVLSGGAGIDVLIGGTGNDTYHLKLGDEFDTITEATGAGTDTVISFLGSYTLGANLENLTLMGSSGLVGLGNALNNVITGNDATNSLGGDAGNDTLIGGGGSDTLAGGTGADVFSYLAASDSILGARDTILDFSRGASTLATRDRIDLSGIDAIVGAGLANDVFSGTLLGGNTTSAPTFTSAGQLRYWNDGANTYLEGNTDSNFGTAEFSIQIAGVFTTLVGGNSTANVDIIL